jgi:hypothetical protein
MRHQEQTVVSMGTYDDAIYSEMEMALSRTSSLVSSKF